MRLASGSGGDCGERPRQARAVWLVVVTLALLLVVTGAFDPLQKRYTRGQEQEAAEDAAFVFFEIRGLPVNHRLYVSAASVGRATRGSRKNPSSSLYRPGGKVI